MFENKPDIAERVEDERRARWLAAEDEHLRLARAAYERGERLLAEMEARDVARLGPRP